MLAMQFLLSKGMKIAFGKKRQAPPSRRSLRDINVKKCARISDGFVPHGPFGALAFRYAKAVTEECHGQRHIVCG